ncbi:MAG: mechanosensitive ion channel family protein [Acidobacteria bacterium]|nr:mechanosensitive ion channel family protein [Acidobacteriota bacterium]
MALTQPIGEAALLGSIARLLLVLAVINLVVALLVNPWREHRASDRFPAIAQDVSIIGLFTVVATLLMRDQLLTTSAVGAVIVGFALQDTLGNFFAGLAIQTEKPFRVGQWIAVGDKEGQVAEITWRATKLRTEAGQFLIVPNSIIAKDPILNYSEPSIPTRIEVVVGVGYQHPPNQVKAALSEALTHAPLVLTTPPPDILVHDFGDFAVVYKMRFWIGDYETHEPARNQVRSAIWYTFQRANIEIPYPIAVEIGREDRPMRPPEAIASAAARLAHLDLFATLSPDQRLALAEACPEKIYQDNQVVVRQGAAGSSMFVVVSGAARVVLEPSGQEVASIEAGGFFGEMSMLTGEPRTATVRARHDMTALEISADRFRALALERPGLVEHVSTVVAARRIGLDEARAAAEAASVTPATVRKTLLERIQRFLHLP